jgi:hypothetical protein
MMSNKDEKWLDDLLSDLPKPEKTGDQISAKLDAFLSEQSAKISASSNVSSLSTHINQKNQRKNWYSQPVGITASFIVVAAIGFGLISQSNSGSISTPKNNLADGPVSAEPIPSESPSVAPSPEPSQEAEQNTSKPSKPASKPTSAPATAEQSQIDILSQGGGSIDLPADADPVAVTKSGKDYSTKLDEILKFVPFYSEPGRINKISTDRIACIVKLKLVDYVSAIDRGTYKAEPVDAFYAYANDGSISIYLTTSGCRLIKTISVN